MTVGTIHLGYAAAAVGYMLGIALLSSGPANPGSGPSAASPLWSLLKVPLFAGLASCLLLSLNAGQWARRVPWRRYGVVILATGAYAAFHAWHPSFIPGRDGDVTGFLLNCLGIAGLVVLHRLSWGDDT